TAPLGALTTGTALLHLEEHGAMALAGQRLKGLGGVLRDHQEAEGGAQIVAEDLPLGRAEVLERRLEGLRVQPGLGAEVDPQLGLTLAGLERGRASALATAVTLTATLALATVTALALLAALLAITPLALLATLTLLAARGAGLTCRCGALGALLTSGFGSTGAIHPQPGEEELEQEGDEIIGVLAALELIGQGQVALVDRAARLLADLPDVPVGPQPRGLLLRGHLLLLEGDAELLLERGEGGQLPARHQVDGGALATDAAGASHAVQVDRGILGEAVVDDPAQVADVDAAGGDVGGHHEGDLSPADLTHHPLALLLREIPVEELGVEAVAVEHRGHQRRVIPRVAEDDGVVRLLHLQRVHEVARLGVLVGDVVADVADVIDGEVVAGEQQRLRVGGVARDEALDVGGDGGAEEQHLPIL